MTPSYLLCIVFISALKFTRHSGQKPILGSMNCPKSLMVPGSPGPLSKPPTMFGQITKLRFFEKINFWSFGRNIKLFGAPKTFVGLRNPTSKTF